MEKPDFEKFEQEGLVIEGDRVLSYSKLICPLDCKYCFSEDLTNVQRGSTVYLSEEQFKLLQNLPENTKTIMLGCDTEFLQNKNEALDILKRLSVLGKDISVITKLILDDNFVESLRIISNEMKNNNNIIVFSTSIPCFDSSSKWEPKVPKVEKRIDTLRRIYNTGISSMVAVRPLIPNIEKSEIDKIIELTNPYVFGYYSGPLYMKDFDEELLQRNELEKLDCTFEKVEPHWMPKGNKFIKIENPELMAYLQGKVKSFGKEFFEGAAKGIEFLRKNKNV